MGNHYSMNLDVFDFASLALLSKIFTHSRRHVATKRPRHNEYGNGKTRHRSVISGTKYLLRVHDIVNNYIFSMHFLD